MSVQRDENMLCTSTSLGVNPGNPSLADLGT